MNAFMFSLTDVDNLHDFVVGTKKRIVQVTKFSVQEVETCDVKVKSSTIPGLSGDFNDIWKFVLAINAAAQTGLALPSTLQQIFTDYQVDIHAGYASAAVNFNSLKKYNAVLKKRLGYELGLQTEDHINLGRM